ncbi:hypothetical protein [Pseudomonas sp. H9]|uniref:hypothetical protein n=1 Tax=Pseudomonas sp. H9 TaxID=483968 RepID=UPI001057AE86|nr:hypothetical protein [Pseudomonas sp. H9]TDF81053.1 hypothetical protein E1573_17675 [Pseudomonas sp. H9]
MQHSALTPRQTALSYFSAFMFVVAMVAIAGFYSDREIILPEISAMAVALWVYRDQNWMRHPEKIFLWPSATALLGFCINLLAIPYAAKLMLVLGAMLMFFLVFRYSLAPALATGFLPVVTNATEISFLLAIVTTTLALMFAVKLAKLRTDHNRSVVVMPKVLAVYAAIILAAIGIAASLGNPHLAVLPPVAVVVYETLHMKMYSWRMVLKQTLALTLSATIGVMVYLYLNNWVAVAAVSLVLMWLLLRLLKMRMPAVYAFPFLAYVFPQQAIEWLPVATVLVSFFSLSLVLAYHVTQNAKASSRIRT